MPRLFMIDSPDFTGKAFKIKVPDLLSVTVKAKEIILL
jgi:hypothetical protein